MGRGSTFHFTSRFGLHDEEVSEPVHADAKDLVDLPVMVIDDNATNRLILVQMLAGWRMKPTAFDAAGPALEALEEALSAGRQFPLVLTDAIMPGIDGFELVNRIRDSPELAGTTIMMLTSDNRLGDAKRCRELGIAAYLMKPVRQSSLLDAIRTSLGERSTDDAQPVQEIAQPVPERQQSLHVLVVEDNSVNQTLALRLLEKRGHTALVADDGRQALAALESEHFDLVLMDVQMPHMDGFEATAAIRGKEKSTGEHIPIVAMTANAMKGDRERCLEGGMDAYLSKPLLSAEFYAVVEGAFDTPPEAEEVSSERHAHREAFDMAAALARFGDDEELFAELADLFVADSPQLLHDIWEAVSRGDHEGLERAAHTLKGSVAAFAAERARQLTSSLESMGRSGNLAEADVTMRALEEEVELVKSAISGVVGEGGE